MMWTDFVEGWMRFWLTFTQPFMVVIGFWVACVAWSFLFEVIKTVFLALWRSIYQ